MRYSPKMLSVLFVTVSLFLPAIQAFIVSGDFVCTSLDCMGALLNITSDSNFSLKCEDRHSCEDSNVVVYSGSTLRPGGIECTDKMSCDSATIVVYDSNLATDANNYLRCDVIYRSACDNMHLTLVDSSIALYCDYDNCRYMEVYLFGSSTLELKQDFDIDYDSLTIYLHDSSAQLIDNGVGGYTLVVAYTTSIPTTTPTPTTSAPRLSSTTMTSTTTPIPHTTTSTVPTPTIPNTTADPTEDGGNGGSNAGSNVIMVVAIGGGVGVLLLVCSFCLGVKYSDSRKHEQGEDEKDAKVQIALVPRTLPKDGGQQYNGSGYATHVVVSTETEHTTEGRMSDADGDAVSSSELSSEMMYMDMPKDYTPGGHLPKAPEGCRRQVEGGAYGIR